MPITKYMTTDAQLNAMRQRYIKLGSPALVDYIYKDMTPAQVDIQKTKPSQIYNHGTGKPESITAGIPGVHVYMLKGPPAKVLGIFYRT